MKETKEKFLPNGETIITDYMKKGFPLYLSNDIEKLVENGNDINQPNKKNETPLNLAFNSLHYIRQKIEGYQTDFRYGSTVTRLKEELIYMDLTIPLIKLGANPKNIFSKEGLTFLGDKITYLTYEGAERLREFLKTTNNPDLYAPDKNGNTPLHILSMPQKDLAIFFIGNNILKNVPINAVNNNHETPLVLGIKEGGNEKLLISLITKGADLNIPDNQGNTALHYAVQKNLLDLILALSSMGADIQKENKEGKTPYMLASCNLVKAFLLTIEEKTKSEKKQIYTKITTQNTLSSKQSTKSQKDRQKED